MCCLSPGYAPGDRALLKRRCAARDYKKLEGGVAARPSKPLRPSLGAAKPAARGYTSETPRDIRRRRNDDEHERCSSLPS